MKDILITSSVLILALLALRQVFQKVLSRRVQYALWALVLVRLLVPVEFFPISDFSVLSATWPVERAVEEQMNQPFYSRPQGQVSQEELDQRNISVESVPTAQDRFSLGESDGFGYPPRWLVRDPETNTVTRYASMTVGPWEFLDMIWKVGMVLVGSFFLLSNLGFYIRLRKNRTEWTPTVSRKVYLVPEGMIPSPCLFFGAIYLTPASLGSEERIRHVLAHEETHARHWDPLWSLLRCVCLTVYWFDPLVWAAAACAKTDCELACDEAVLERLGEEERVGYGQTLLSLIPVKRGSNPFLTATTMTAGKKQLKDRITRIAQKPRQVMAAVVVMAVLITAVSACTLTGWYIPYDLLYPSAEPEASPAITESLEPSPTPAPVESQEPEDFTPLTEEVLPKEYGFMLTKADGTVWTWGRNTYGQLGDGTLPEWESGDLNGSNQGY